MIYHLKFTSWILPTQGNSIISINKTKIINWGDKNFYPFFLNYIYLNSPTHGGIINGKVNYLLGAGFAIDDKMNSNGLQTLTINEILNLCIQDLEKFNGFALKVVQGLNGKEIEYVPFAKVRQTDNGMFAVFETGSTRKFDIYEDYFKAGAELPAIAYFNATGTTEYVDENEQPQITLYPIPSYYSAIRSILTEIEASIFNLAEIKNGFKQGTLITLTNGVPANEEDRLKIVNEIKARVSDKSEWGGLVITFSDGKERAPEVTPLTGNDLVDRYSQLRTQMIDSIMIGHSVTSPLLFGVKTQGQLGGTQELEIAYGIFKSQYIEPRRKMVEDFFSQVLEVNLKIKDITPPFLQQTTVQAPTMQEQKKQEPLKLSDEDEMILKEFERFGKKEVKGIEIEAIPIEYEGMDFDEIERTYQRKLLNFEAILTERQLRILEMLRSRNDLTTIIATIGVGTDIILKDLSILQDFGLIDKDLKVTSKGKDKLKNSPFLLKTYYQYRVRPGFGAPIIPTTRDFCRRLIEMGKFYERWEIENISRIVGRDVWLYRGGFYHNPNTGLTTPNCRHIWYQILMKESR